MQLMDSAYQKLRWPDIAKLEMGERQTLDRTGHMRLLFMGGRSI